MTAAGRKRLGDILIEMGAIDALQLKSALGYAEQWGMLLGKALLEKHFCSEADVTRAVSIQTGLAIVDLDRQELEAGLAALIPAKVAERHRVIPLRVEGKRQEVLVVGTAAPLGLEALDEIRMVSRKQRVTAVVVSDSAAERALDFLYHGKPRPVVAPEVPLEGDRRAGGQGEAAAKSTAVWLLGWHDARSRALQRMLSIADVDAQPLTDDALDSIAEGDVVLSSTLALQSLLPAGQRFARGQLIICGLTDDLDMADAKAVGARMYLRPPFSPEQLKRAIRSLQGRPGGK